jgi:hypothetical protein
MDGILEEAKTPQRDSPKAYSSEGFSGFRGK